jgi:anti-anti-sigma factor
VTVSFEIFEDMDAAGMRRLRADLERLAESEDDVELDLSRVDFIDSSGIGGIVFLYKRLRAGGHDLRLCRVRPQPRKLFHNLRMTHLLSG